MRETVKEKLTALAQEMRAWRTSGLGGQTAEQLDRWADTLDRLARQPEALTLLNAYRNDHGACVALRDYDSRCALCRQVDTLRSASAPRPSGGEQA